MKKRTRKNVQRERKSKSFTRNYLILQQEFLLNVKSQKYKISGKDYKNLSKAFKSKKPLTVYSKAIVKRKVVRKKLFDISPIKPEITKKTRTKTRYQLSYTLAIREPPYFVSIKAVTIDRTVTKGLRIAIDNVIKQLSRRKNIDFSVFNDGSYMGISAQTIPASMNKELDDGSVWIEIFVGGDKSSSISAKSSEGKTVGVYMNYKEMLQFL